MGDGTEVELLHTREYGTDGAYVALLHGGPGAPGYMQPVARSLEDQFHLLEPFQRRSGAKPLTVATHIDDLRELLQRRCGDRPTALVGHSWGAMLALAYAAQHSRDVDAIVLIGCGTFDRTARERMHEINAERLTASLEEKLEALFEMPDADEQLKARASLLLARDSYDVICAELPCERVDARGHDETWSDMLRLQDEGVYPDVFTSIRAPVIMLHGAVDPHPGKLIRDSLKPYLPQLEYHEWQKCGHYPWLERAVKDEFFTALRGWLEGQLRPC